MKRRAVEYEKNIWARKMEWVKVEHKNVMQCHFNAYNYAFEINDIVLLGIQSFIFHVGTFACLHFNFKLRAATQRRWRRRRRREWMRAGKTEYSKWRTNVLTYVFLVCVCVYLMRFPTLFFQFHLSYYDKSNMFCVWATHNAFYLLNCRDFKKRTRTHKNETKPNE